ncbi:putative cystatin [Helianthus annuus]|nr:putative cystatin [Helianthus annuus]
MLRVDQQTNLTPTNITLTKSSQLQIQRYNQSNPSTSTSATSSSLKSMATLGGLHNSSSSNSADIDSLARFAVEEHNKKEEGSMVMKAMQSMACGKISDISGPIFEI